MKQPRELTDLLLSIDKEKEIENKLDELERKKQELKQSKRISDMLWKFLLVSKTKGQVTEDMMQIQIEDDFWYCKQAHDGSNVIAIEKANQKKSDCNFLKEFFSSCGFKYDYTIELKDTSEYEWDGYLDYHHTIIIQTLNIPLVKHNELIKEIDEKFYKDKNVKIKKYNK